jgi:flagellar protein FlgJ
MIGNGTPAVTDFSAYAALRADARQGTDKAANLDQVARQFESLFIHMMVKQMRQASLGSSMLDSDQSLFYRDMYDQQLSSGMADSGGIGLRDAIVRQLGGTPDTSAASGRTTADYLAAPTRRAPALQPAVIEQSESRGPATGFADQEDFIKRLRPYAQAAARRLGVPAEALLAQAALETGWGRAMPSAANGEPSHNLFGIKADTRWDGERVSVQTLEYRDGVAMKTRADFRAYASFADSFADYADFVAGNPRYRQALQSAGDPQQYFQALQQAGYATDPSYADKVQAILARPELQPAQATRPVKI